MANHNGSWYPIGPTKWDAQGNPYRDTSDGMKDYIPPITAAQYTDDPKMLQWAAAHGASINKDAAGNIIGVTDTSHTNGNFTGNYTWNSDQGGYDKNNFFDSSLGGLILGGSAVAAPFAASALMAPAAATSAAPAAAAADGAFDVGALTAASTGLPVTAGLGTAGATTLASTPIASGIFTAPTSASAPVAGASTAAAAPVASTVGSNTLGTSIPSQFGSSAVDTVADTATPGLSSTPIASGIFTAPTSAGTNVAGMATSGLGNQLVNGLKNPQNLANLSKVIQQYGTDAQGNRVIQGNMADRYDRNMLAAEAQRNSTENDSIRKLNIANYILNGPQTGYQPGSITLNGQTRQLPTFGSGYIAPSAAMRQGATDMQTQANARLKPGGTYTPMPFSSYGTPGAGEQASNYIGTGLGIAGTITNMFNK